MMVSLLSRRGAAWALPRRLEAKKLSVKMLRWMSSAPDTSASVTETETHHPDNPEYAYHVPVMLQECMEYLNVTPGKVYLDGTLGGGGHTHEILKRGGKVIALDQDPDAIQQSSQLLSSYLQNGSLEIHQTNFRNMPHVIAQHSRLAQGQPIDGVLLDLGVSSFQINEYTRGFAFGGDGPLDMRMNKGVIHSQPQVITSATTSSSSTQSSVNTLTAAEILNHWTEDEIADILYHYGEETKSRRIARAIVNERPLRTTCQLESAISQITSFKERPKTLARCFQALRIKVNDELGALEETLQFMHQCLRPKGRLVIMSYHSLEDRRVKHYLKSGMLVGSGQQSQSDGQSDSYDDNHHSTRSPSNLSANNVFRNVHSSHDDHSETSHATNLWHILTKKAVVAGNTEVDLNRRARSAKLRCAERLGSSPDSSESQETDGTTPNNSMGTKKKTKFLGAKELRKLEKKRERQATGPFDD